MLKTIHDVVINPTKENQTILLKEKQAHVQELFEYRQSLEKARKAILQLNLILKQQQQDYRNLQEEFNSVKTVNQERIDSLMKQVMQFQEKEMISKQQQNEFKEFFQAVCNKRKDQILGSAQSREQEEMKQTKALDLWRPTKKNAIAFNQQLTTIVIGGKDIELFQLKDCQAKKTQVLSDHANEINALYYMKNYNQFISGAKGEIGIWNQNVESLDWFCFQMIKQAHNDIVNRVIMNQNEDLIISCSYDCTIKFWIRKNYWECCQTIDQHTDKIFNISLDESGTKLVSSGQDSQMLIIQQQGKIQWTVIQKISTSTFSPEQICFVGENFLISKAHMSSNFIIYELNQQNKQFQKCKNIRIEGVQISHNGYQMKFHEKQETLSFRAYESFFLIKIKDRDLFIEKQINIRNNSTLEITNDCQNLVCVDKFNKFQLINIK